MPLRRPSGPACRATGIVLALCALWSPVTTAAADAAPASRPAAAPHAAPAPAMGPVPSAPVPSALAASRPCGTRTGPAGGRWRHVVWIWFENHSRDEVAGPPGSAARAAMPYWNAVADACGQATAYRALTHPSRPNYVAAVTGGLPRVVGNCAPAACPEARASLFRQADAARIGWRAYAQSMPVPCATSDAGRYAPRHNPAAYDVALRRSCRAHDLPLGPWRGGALGRDVDAGRLPGFTFVVPDLCASAHDCPLRTADGWLAAWLPRILRGPDYRRGDTVVLLTWDEGSGGAARQDCRRRPDRSCEVSTLVVAPTVAPGTRASTPFDHYSLLRTTQDLLGLRPLLGAARSATSMRAAFRL